MISQNPYQTISTTKPIEFGFSTVELTKSVASDAWIWFCDDEHLWEYIPKVYITSRVHALMWLYTCYCAHTEVKWWLSCRLEASEEDGETIVVEDAFVPPQNVSRSHAETEQEDDLEAMEIAPTAGIDLNSLWGSGHSHHDMQVFTSTVDAREIKKRLDGIVRPPKFPEDQFIVRVITNLRQEWAWTVVNVKLGLACMLPSDRVLIESIDMEELGELSSHVLAEISSRVLTVTHTRLRVTTNYGEYLTTDGLESDPDEEDLDSSERLDLVDALKCGHLIDDTTELVTGEDS